MNHDYVLKLIIDNTPPTAGAGEEPDPACECIVRTTSGYQMQGILAEATNGFKLAMPSQMANPDNPRVPGKKVLAEHFFSAEAIECIVFLRPVDPAIVRGIDRGPLIVTG